MRKVCVRGRNDAAPHWHLSLRYRIAQRHKWLAELARTDVLILDDWGTGSIDAVTRADLLEVIDDRAGQRATIVTHQLPVDHWRGWIGDATIADAILDRLMPKAHRFNLEGPSRRGPRPARPTPPAKAVAKG